MKCPECGVEFRGGAFSRSLPGHKSVRMRQCTNDHQFPEPPKPKRDSREVRELKAECAKLMEFKTWANNNLKLLSDERDRLAAIIIEDKQIEDRAWAEVGRLVTVLRIIEWSNSSYPTWYRDYARSALKSVIVNSAPASTTEVES